MKNGVKLKTRCQQPQSKNSNDPVAFVQFGIKFMHTAYVCKFLKTCFQQLLLMDDDVSELFYAAL